VRWRSRAVRAFGALLLVAAAFASLARQRFRADDLTFVSPRVEREALTRKVALVVLDGVRFDRFLATFPRTHELARARGVFCPSTTGPLTFTVTGVYTLGTGAFATMALLPQNFQAQPVQEDSLPASLARVGKRTVVIGEQVWSDLFERHVARAVTVRDLGPYSDERLPGSALLARALAEDRCELCVWHDPGIDHRAHLHGVFGKGYVEYALDLDQQLSAVGSESDGATTWIVTSDHGSVDSGNHGGDQPETRASFFAAWGPGIRRGECPAPISQADVPTLASALLGAPIPAMSEGGLPAVLDAGEPARRAQLDAELLAQKRTLLCELGRARGTVVPPASGVEDITRQIASLKRPSSLRLGLSLLPLVLGVVLSLAAAQLDAAALRSAPLWVGAAFVGLQVLLAHYALPELSLTAAGLAYGGTVALLVAALVPLLRVRERSLAALSVFVAVASLAVTEAHWVILVAPLTLVLGAWFAAPRRARAAVTLGTALVSALITALGWAYVLDSTKDVQGAQALLLTLPAAALYGAVTRLGPWSQKLRATPAPVAITLLAFASPVPLRPYLPLAVAACALIGRRFHASSLGALEGALLTLSLLQMGGLQWSFLVLAGALAPRLLDRAEWEGRLGERLSHWLRGGVLVASSYLFVVAEGNRISPSDVKVLAGFLGGALPLWLPLTGVLLCLYYSAGPILVLCSWLRQSAELERVKSGARAAVAILAVKLLYLGTNFAWGGMSQGSWAKQLIECLLAASWLTTLSLIAELWRRAERSRESRVAAGTAVNPACSRTSFSQGA
jgi:hypothetical protein